MEHEINAKGKGRLKEVKDFKGVCVFNCFLTSNYANCINARPGGY